jgi:hypothetical protein
MRVLEPVVHVHVRVGASDSGLVRVLVVLVVDVQVLVLDVLMDVHVRVPFPQQKVDAKSHQRPRQSVAPRELLAEHGNRQDGGGERRRGE